MAERERLPGRREHEVLEIEHMSLRCRGGVGRYSDPRIAKGFLDIAKYGSAGGVNARDSATAARLALQYGCDLEVMCSALTQNPDGSGAGPLSRLLDLLATPVEGAP